MFYPSPYVGRFVAPMGTSGAPCTPPRNAPDRLACSFDWPMSVGEKHDRNIFIQGSALKEAQSELQEQEEERGRNDEVVRELQQHFLGVHEQADVLTELSDKQIGQLETKNQRLGVLLQEKEQELAAKSAQLV